MDWIKVLNKHILYEYNDLKDSEFAAWIKIMALTAHLEHEPTRKQILSHVNYQTLDSLSKKLHDHSIDLSYILHKVLIDVAYVSHRREALKNNTQRYRDNKKAVIDNVIITSQIREDKIREEKRIEAANAPFILPSKEEIQEASDLKIEECIQQVCTRLYEEKIFPEVYAFKGKAIKGKKNGRGVLHVLTRCYLARPKDPWAYCQKIIAVEDLNYNERDYRKTAQ